VIKSRKVEKHLKGGKLADKHLKHFLGRHQTNIPRFLNLFFKAWKREKNKEGISSRNSS
jgi:hypothetical protein